MDFSLLFFSGEDNNSQNKYKLFLNSVKFADKNNFKSVWIPERHFHPFGGLYPNPSVLASAVAVLTKNIRIRSGSIVIPLHNPVRVAEEWSVVDNLSNGRVDLGFAKGWSAKDFIFFPNNFHDRSSVMYDNIEKLKKILDGELYFLDGKQEEQKITIYPKPRQKTFNIWITVAKSEDEFYNAGKIGANILTALLFQDKDELKEKISIYRKSRAENGHKGKGCITLMLHTFLGNNAAEVKSLVKKHFIKYLETSIDLWKDSSQKLENLNEKQKQSVLEYAFERYYRTNALFGTTEYCSNFVSDLKSIGVNEIACLIDFGVEYDNVIKSLTVLKKLKNSFENNEV